MAHHLFTSESVTEGHPDKICDQISDAILDAILAQDPNGRVACECTVTTGVVNVMGEITTDCYVDIPKVVRQTVREIGYDRAKYGFDCETCAVITNIDEQSADIALGVDQSLESKETGDSALDNGAGDQGMMFGFACDETPELMPLPLSLAQKLCKRMAEVRKSGQVPYMRPDGKSQVTVEYDENNRPVRVDTVVITGQQRYTEEEIREASGIAEGANLVLFNKYTAANNIVSALPYIEEISINRKLPDTLLIQVRECSMPLAVVQEGSAWLVSPSGKIVDQQDAAAAAEYAQIDGCELLAPSVGTRLALATEYTTQQSSLLSLLAALENRQELEHVDAIHLGDTTMLTMDYDGRFTIQLSYGADYDRKLRMLRQILDESGAIQDNMTGTFDMRGDDGTVNLIQNVR